MKKLENVKIDAIHPYANNPRKNEDAVDVVAESIKQCEYIAPIIVDENYEILAGHTRYKALQRLGYENIDILVIDNLTENQKKKYRLLDNKTNELSYWDEKKLAEELQLVDFDDYDFGFVISPASSVNDFFSEPIEQSEKKKKTVICPYCGKETEI